jgi:hypothetical protein
MSTLPIIIQIEMMKGECEVRGDAGAATIKVKK